jgi:hypothetical protein
MRTAGDVPKQEIVDFSFFCVRLQPEPQLPKPPDQIDYMRAK